MITLPHNFYTDIDAQVVHFAQAKMHGSIQHSLVRQMSENCVATIGAAAFFGVRLRSHTFYYEEESL